MQTAALVYRPPMPATERSPHQGESRNARGNPKALRVLVAGSFDLPIRDVSDRVSRVISRAFAPDFQTVLNLLRELPFVDLVMLDAALAGFKGIEDLRRLGDHAAETPIVVVCNAGEEKNAATYLRNGAAGVVPGDLSGEALASAIQLILSGQRFAPADLLMERTGPDQSAGSIMDSLSTREKEVACRLGLQEITIKVYASAVFRKLGVRNRTAAAARLLAEAL